MRSGEVWWTLRRVTLRLFCFKDAAPTEIYTLSLHDALPILGRLVGGIVDGAQVVDQPAAVGRDARDRKSTRLNSSHVEISYAVFCLKKKTTTDHLRAPPRGYTHPESTNQPTEPTTTRPYASP